MGLASKLAAAQGGTTAVANYSSQPPGAYPGGPGDAQAGAPTSYPGKSNYHPYPGGQAPDIAQQKADNWMPLASRLGVGGAGVPPYPFALQPAYPQQQQPGAGYQSPGAYPGQQQQSYSRPPPPPPGQTPAPYPGQAPAYGQNPQSYNLQAYGQNQGYPSHQGPSGGYGGYSGAPPQQQGGYGQPLPGQYGAPQGQHYGGQQPPMGGAGPNDVAGYARELERAIQEKQLQAFYQPGDPRIQGIAARAAQQIDRLCQAWRIQKEIANDIVRLALYDVVVYIDDSGSMSFEENGQRIEDLLVIMQRVAFAATLFDDDGIDVRFMNDDKIPLNMLSGIRTEQQVQQILASKTYKGLTPFGTQLRQKVIDPILVSRLTQQQLRKPLLVISITDGQPAGESSNALHETVQYAVNAARSSRYGQGAIAFQFAQVGNDQKATEFLAKLDNDRDVGAMVDCTSNYENESAEMTKAEPPVDLTPDLWMIKLIMGAIDPSYDTKDEKNNMAGGVGPPQGGHGGAAAGPPQYGGQPVGYGGQQQQYGGQPPQYGGQQQGGYGTPQGQGGYPGQQAGYRPPPGQGGYPPQGQGGYGGGPQGPPRY